tara:strand:- start:4393 stop:4743 length:351 start_codon:yes stop_codon:yes gene_type:complete
MKISENIESTILNSIDNYDQSYTLGNPFEELMSMGELVDRLAIVNFKLYKLKDEVMLRPTDEEFKSWASVEDVKLVMERARLKKCIDEKVISMFTRYKSGDSNAGFNPEVKKYGNE